MSTIPDQACARSDSSGPSRPPSRVSMGDDCALDVHEAAEGYALRMHEDWVKMEKSDRVARRAEWEVLNEEFGALCSESSVGVPRIGDGADWFPTYPVTCFSRACFQLGVKVEVRSTSVGQLSHDESVELASCRGVKVVLYVYGIKDKRNHVVLTDSVSSNALVSVTNPILGELGSYQFVCTSPQEFFNVGSKWSRFHFYADAGAGGGDSEDLGFGGMLPGSGLSGGGKPDVPRAQSVADEDVAGGASNVSGGVLRHRKRTLKPRGRAKLEVVVDKRYRTSGAVMFNNIEEMFGDAVSRDEAQEIVERVFEIWGVPLDQPDSARFAEDMLWAFLVATTASNKADYNRKFDVPVRSGVGEGDMLEVDFGVLSKVLESEFGTTRRRFARAVADDLRSYLRQPDNQFMLPILATRIGCEPQLADLAFDGSTHCTGLTSREVAFTKTLEARNLFERDDVLAQGASDRLMQGIGGARTSVVPR